MLLAGVHRHDERMDEANYVEWAHDAEVLARIGWQLSGQPMRIAVRLSRDLADQAVAAWQRDDDEGPLPPGRPEQRAIRRKAATLALIGLAIENGGRTESSDVIVALDAWHVGDAYNAADDAGLLTGAEIPNSETQAVKKLEVPPAYCCRDLQEHAEYICPQHQERFDCPDVIISRLSTGATGIPVHDGGNSMIVINNCPWCGASLAVE